MIEVCLNIEPFMQPHPAKNPGGDCFACATTAALRHLFPERAPSFEQVFTWFTPDGEKTPNNTWPGLRQTLYEADAAGFGLEIEADLVMPEWEPERYSHPWYQYEPDGRYARRLEAWLRAGWVAWTEINYAGGGPVTPEGRLRTQDHFVLLDGVRSLFEAAGAGCWVERHYIHVVCSVKGAYWVNLQDFARQHGAAGWWLARRDNRS